MIFLLLLLFCFVLCSIIVVLCSGVLYSYTVTVHKDDADQRNAHPVRDS